jgi:hypothetical protein
MDRHSVEPGDSTAGADKSMGERPWKNSMGTAKGLFRASSQSPKNPLRMAEACLCHTGLVSVSMQNRYRLMSYHQSTPITALTIG